jgi:dihydrolipoyl dehydrogenase
MERFDVVVIGAGPGGYPAAIRAAQLGASVAIVERERLGGTCLNFGCIPTKALIASADAYHRLGDMKSFGVSVERATLDYAAMIERKDKVVGQLRDGVAQLLTANGVRQFAGAAAFRDRETIAIDGAEAIGAKKTIIATGSTSATPDFLPRHDRVVESRAFLSLSGLPERLIVLGGGYIGCEIASMAAMLDVKVVIVELLADILMLLDADLRSEVRGYMEKRLGVRVLTGRPLADVSADASGVRHVVGDETLRADLLLNAVGRKPVTNGLGLEKAGLSVNARGFIDTDDYCRTKAATIFAVGDVAGKTQLAHFATAQGLVAAENAVGSRPRRHPTLVPNVIFTAPEVATVGVSETDAAGANRAVKTGKFRFSGLGKGLAAGETTGFVKWIADAATEQLIGAAAVGPHATELIAAATTAIRAEFTAHELGATIHAHPTFSEAWMEAAHALRGECVHAPPRRRWSAKKPAAPPRLWPDLREGQRQ